MRNIVLAFCFFLTIPIYSQKFDLAKTPPMGWNSWNKFACNINEDLIRQTADAMVSTGMRDAGYSYINIDDCWHGKRDSLGFIHPDPKRFPSGMKALADYVHSKGLKIGIYSDAGKQTCGGHPGARGHEYQDAITYAQWGIDYLKFDWCNTDGLKAEESYKTMRDAIYSAKHPMVFSICEWGNSKPWTWGKDVGHLWRTTGDIYPCWNCELGHGNWVSNGVLRILDMQKDIRQFAGPGHWNDPDMLEVGNEGLTVSEARAHFSLWCMLAAPLIAGNDLRDVKKEILDILTNKEIIALDQDSLGIQCFKFIDNVDWQIYLKPLSKGDFAACFLNRGEKVMKIDFNWKAYYINDGDNNVSYDCNKNTYKIRDLWAKKDIGNTNENFKTDLQPHDVIVLRLSK